MVHLLSEADEYPAGVEWRLRVDHDDYLIPTACLGAQGVSPTLSGHSAA